MKFFIELFVVDIYKSRQFYVDALGMEVVKSESNYVALEKDNVQINLCNLKTLEEDHYLRSQDKNHTLLGTKVEFCIEVKNLEKAYQQVVDAGFPIHETITKRAWKRTDFRIIDPDGAYWRITTPVFTSDLEEMRAI